MRATLVIVTGAAALGLTGCAAPSGPPSQARTAGPTAPVIAPGKPGEPARTLKPGEVATAIPSPVVNAADIRFIQDMIVHHRQALDMSLLAPSRASSPALKRLAARILDAQGPEITAMAAWLRRQGQPVPGHSTAHRGQSGAMPGMASPRDLAALRAARGEVFDRLYTSLMIDHHQGAIVMVAKVLGRGSHPWVRETAEDIAVTQAVEIARLRRITP